MAIFNSYVPTLQSIENFPSPNTMMAMAIPSKLHSVENCTSTSGYFSRSSSTGAIWGDVQVRYIQISGTRSSGWSTEWKKTIGSSWLILINIQKYTKIRIVYGSEQWSECQTLPLSANVFSGGILPEAPWSSSNITMFHNQLEPLLKIQNIFFCVENPCCAGEKKCIAKNIHCFGQVSYQSTGVLIETARQPVSGNHFGHEAAVVHSDLRQSNGSKCCDINGQHKKIKNLIILGVLSGMHRKKYTNP